MFDIRPDERRLVWILFLFSFLLGIPRYFTNTASDALFLTEYGAQNLPLVYIGFAIFAPLASTIYAALSTRLRLGRLLVGALAILLLMLAGFWVLIVVVEAPWPTLAFAVWFWVLWVISSIVFWSVAGRLFNVRQAKRLFGLIGAGEIVAAVSGGFVITPLLRVIGTANLLLVGLAGGIGALILLRLIIRLHPALNTLPSPPPTPRPGSVTKPIKGGRNPYVLLIFTVSFLSVASYMILDNTYYALAEIQYPDDLQLASFIGVFFAAVGFGSFITKLLFDAPFLRRFGVRGGIIALPISVVVGTLIGVGVTAVAGIGPEVVPLVFWITVVTKLVDRWMRDAMDKTSIQALYQPLPAGQRLKALTQVEGIVEPIAAGAAGLGLLLLNRVFVLEPMQLLYPLLVLAAVWLVAGLLLGRRYYPAMLARALRQRRWTGDELLTADASSIGVLQRTLQNKDPGAALYAMNRLASYDPQTLLDNLPLLFEHPSPVVRREALGWLEQLHQLALAHRVLLLPAVQQLLARETTAEVRGLALQTYAWLCDADEVLEHIQPYLNDPEPAVQTGAIVGLFRSEGIEGVLAAGERLLALVRSADGGERVMAAHILGRVGERSFYRPLIHLLKDPSSEVRGAALGAAAKVRSPRLWPLVVGALADPQTAGVAAAALRAGGETAVPALAEYMSRQAQPFGTFKRIARLLGQIGGPEATAALIGQREHPHPLVRTQVLEALSQSGFQAQGEAVKGVEEQLVAEAGRANWFIEALSDLEADDNDALALVHRAIQSHIQLQQQQIIWLLTFLYDRELMLSLGGALDNTLVNISAENQAYALETLDITLSAHLKAVLFPLFRYQSTAVGHSALPASQPSVRLARLHTLSTRDALEAWTQACALFALTNEYMAAPSPALERLVRDLAWEHQIRDDPLLVETACWALARSGSVTEMTEERRMLTIIERVIFLRGVELFRAVPDEVLARLAEVTCQEEVAAGEQFIHQGAADRSLYLIIDGQADIVINGMGKVATRGAKDVIGEMALLSDRPRTANVIAASDMTVLKIEQADFQMIMDESPELSQGIIQVLVDRLEEVLQRETALISGEKLNPAVP